MRRGGVFSVLRIRPWSWHAFTLGVVVVAAAAAVQAICVAMGADLYFAAFLPGIFLVGMLAGVPAAAFALLLTIPVVWWVFMPPSFAFTSLTSSYAHAINLFFLFGGLLIGFADLCRETMTITSRAGLVGVDEDSAPNSQ